MYCTVLVLCSAHIHSRAGLCIWFHSISMKRKPSLSAEWSFFHVNVAGIILCLHSLKIMLSALVAWVLPWWLLCICSTDDWGFTSYKRAKYFPTSCYWSFVWWKSHQETQKIQNKWHKVIIECFWCDQWLKYVVVKLTKAFICPGSTKLFLW